MKYVKKTNTNNIDEYSITRFEVDHALQYVKVYLTHTYHDNKTIKTDLMEVRLDDSLSFVIDPSFAYTKENVENLMKNDSLFNINDPTTWMRVQEKLPKIEVPNKKFYSNCKSVDSNIERYIIECLKINGNLPVENGWDIE